MARKIPTKTAERLQEIVQRAQDEVANLSTQPRFKPQGDSKSTGTFATTYNRLKQSFMDEKAYSVDSRVRDTWLREFVKMEPHLTGVVNSVVGIDKNRGWSLVGPEEQVDDYQLVLKMADDGLGWRQYISKQSLSFYTSDLGSVNENGRTGQDGPLAAIYSVDPTRCRLTNDVLYPLEYFPSSGSETLLWGRDDFFRIASMPTNDETMHDLGWCAISRSIRFAQLMIAVFMHDMEELGSRSAEGLLLLNNISQDQWNTAMKQRQAMLDSLERRWFGGVAVLASSGVDQIDAKLVALSQLPKNFDRDQFTNSYMYGLALIFGYDPGEFWPIAGGTFGRGTEVNMQARKATGKGGRDFILGYQDRLQAELPPTIYFEFEQRDEEGQMVTAALLGAKAEYIEGMYESGLQQGAPLLTRDEARSLLAQENVIPREWTEEIEEMEATDTTDELTPSRRWYHQLETKRRMLEMPQVLRSIRLYPQSPIAEYKWPQDRIRIIYERATDISKRILHPSLSLRSDKLNISRPKTRANQEKSRATLFDTNDEYTTITDDDVDEAIAGSYSDEFAQILENEPFTDEQLEESLAEGEE